MSKLKTCVCKVTGQSQCGPWMGTFTKFIVFCFSKQILLLIFWQSIANDSKLYQIGTFFTRWSDISNQSIVFVLLVEKQLYAQRSVSAFNSVCRLFLELCSDVVMLNTER